ncbi:MAG: hypothetical protein IT430_03950 [Phycisphaerales bacterium]|nr:hypothetical protein [Phycisphaerales bacterium]
MRAIEYFPDSEGVQTLEMRLREDDAIMLARCMRDEAKARGHSVTIEVRRIGERVKHYCVAARKTRRRRAG